MVIIAYQQQTYIEFIMPHKRTMSNSERFTIPTNVYNSFILLDDHAHSRTHARTHTHIHTHSLTHIYTLTHTHARA